MSIFCLTPHNTQADAIASVLLYTILSCTLSVASVQAGRDVDRLDRSATRFVHHQLHLSSVCLITAHPPASPSTTYTTHTQCHEDNSFDGSHGDDDKARERAVTSATERTSKVGDGRDDVRAHMVSECAGGWKEKERGRQ